MAKKDKKKKPPRKKHRAFNFVLSLLIILAAAGAVFWFGWVQFSLGEGDYAVIYTKTNGYESAPLANGEFAWRWQALLPTNLTLHIFNLDNRTLNIEKSGKLPSGDYYARITGEDINFDWDIKVKIVYRMNPEALPSLVANGLLSPDLESYYKDFESDLNSELVNLISAEVESDPEENIGSRIDRLENSISEKAVSLSPYITVIDAEIRSWNYPDLSLYSEARRLVLEMMNKRQTLQSELEDSAVRRDDAIGTRIGLLEEYGRVLEEYPVLLELFALEGHPGASLLPPEEL